MLLSSPREIREAIEREKNKVLGSVSYHDTVPFYECLVVLI